MMCGVLIENGDDEESGLDLFMTHWVNAMDLEFERIAYEDGMW